MWTVWLFAGHLLGLVHSIEEVKETAGFRAEYFDQLHNSKSAHAIGSPKVKRHSFSRDAKDRTIYDTLQHDCSDHMDEKYLLRQSMVRRLRLLQKQRNESHVNRTVVLVKSPKRVEDCHNSNYQYAFFTSKPGFYCDVAVHCKYLHGSVCDRYTIRMFKRIKWLGDESHDHTHSQDIPDKICTANKIFYRRVEDNEEVVLDLLFNEHNPKKEDNFICGVKYECGHINGPQKRPLPHDDYQPTPSDTLAHHDNQNNVDGHHNTNPHPSSSSIDSHDNKPYYQSEQGREYGPPYAPSSSHYEANQYVNTHNKFSNHEVKTQSSQSEVSYAYDDHSGVEYSSKSKINSGNINNAAVSNSKSHTQSYYEKGNQKKHSEKKSNKQHATHSEKHYESIQSGKEINTNYDINSHGQDSKQTLSSESSYSGSYYGQESSDSKKSEHHKLKVSKGGKKVTNEKHLISSQYSHGDANQQKSYHSQIRKEKVQHEASKQYGTHSKKHSESTQSVKKYQYKHDISSHDEYSKQAVNSGSIYGSSLQSHESIGSKKSVGRESESSKGSTKVDNEKQLISSQYSHGDANQKKSYHAQNSRKEFQKSDAQHNYDEEKHLSSTAEYSKTHGGQVSAKSHNSKSSYSQHSNHNVKSNTVQSDSYKLIKSKNTYAHETKHKTEIKSQGQYSKQKANYDHKQFGHTPEEEIDYSKDSKSHTQKYLVGNRNADGTSHVKAHQYSDQESTYKNVYQTQGDKFSEKYNNGKHSSKGEGHSYGYVSDYSSTSDGTQSVTSHKSIQSIHPKYIDASHYEETGQTKEISHHGKSLAYHQEQNAYNQGSSNKNYQQSLVKSELNYKDSERTTKNQKSYGSSQSKIHISTSLKDKISTYHENQETDNDDEHRINDNSQVNDHKHQVHKTKHAKNTETSKKVVTSTSHGSQQHNSHSSIRSQINKASANYENIGIRQHHTASEESLQDKEKGDGPSHPHSVKHKSKENHQKVQQYSASNIHNQKATGKVVSKDHNDKHSYEISQENKNQASAKSSTNYHVSQGKSSKTHSDVTTYEKNNENSYHGSSAYSLQDTQSGQLGNIQGSQTSKEHSTSHTTNQQKKSKVIGHQKQKIKVKDYQQLQYGYKDDTINPYQTPEKFTSSDNQKSQKPKGNHDLDGPYISNANLDTPISYKIAKNHGVAYKLGKPHQYQASNDDDVQKYIHQQPPSHAEIIITKSDKARDDVHKEYINQKQPHDYIIRQKGYDDAKQSYGYHKQKADSVKSLESKSKSSYHQTNYNEQGSYQQYARYGKSDQSKNVQSHVGSQGKKYSDQHSYQQQDKRIHSNVRGELKKHHKVSGHETNAQNEYAIASKGKLPHVYHASDIDQNSQDQVDHQESNNDNYKIKSTKTFDQKSLHEDKYIHTQKKYHKAENAKYSIDVEQYKVNKQDVKKGHSQKNLHQKYEYNHGEAYGDYNEEQTDEQSHLKNDPRKNYKGYKIQKDVRGKGQYFSGYQQESKTHHSKHKAKSGKHYVDVEQYQINKQDVKSGYSQKYQDQQYTYDRGEEYGNYKNEHIVRESSLNNDARKNYKGYKIRKDDRSKGLSYPGYKQESNIHQSEHGTNKGSENQAAVQHKINQYSNNNQEGYGYDKHINDPYDQSNYYYTNPQHKPRYSNGNYNQKEAAHRPSNDNYEYTPSSQKESKYFNGYIQDKDYIKSNGYKLSSHLNYGPGDKKGHKEVPRPVKIYESTYRNPNAIRYKNANGYDQSEEDYRKYAAYPSYYENDGVYGQTGYGNNDRYYPLPWQNVATQYHYPSQEATGDNDKPDDGTESTTCKSTANGQEVNKPLPVVETYERPPPALPPYYPYGRYYPTPYEEMVERYKIPPWLRTGARKTPRLYFYGRPLESDDEGRRVGGGGRAYTVPIDFLRFYPKLLTDLKVLEKDLADAAHVDDDKQGSSTPQDSSYRNANANNTISDEVDFRQYDYVDDYIDPEPADTEQVVDIVEPGLTFPNRTLPPSGDCGGCVIGPWAWKEAPKSHIHFINCIPMRMPVGNAIWKREEEEGDSRGEKGVEWDYFCPIKLFRGAVWRHAAKFDQVMRRCVDIDRLPQHCKQEVSLEEQMTPKFSPKGLCRTLEAGGAPCLDRAYRNHRGQWLRGCDRITGQCATQSTLEGFSTRYGTCDQTNNPQVCMMTKNQLDYVDGIDKPWLRE